MDIKFTKPKNIKQTKDVSSEQNYQQKNGKMQEKISKKLKKRNWAEQLQPMLKATNIHHEFDGRYQGIYHRIVLSQKSLVWIPVAACSFAGERKNDSLYKNID